MHWCNAILLHCISSPHSLNSLGLGCRLKSTSGTEPSLLPHTCDTAPVKSKVALQLTASQGVDYYSMASTVNLCHHREGNHHCMDCHMSVNTPYIIITAQVPLHIYMEPISLLVRFGTTFLVQ